MHELSLAGSHQWVKLQLSKEKRDSRRILVGIWMHDEGSSKGEHSKEMDVQKEDCRCKLTNQRKERS